MATNLINIIASIAYTCRYSSGQLIPIFQSLAVAEVILIPRYEYDIIVITRIRGEAEYEC